MSTSGVCGEHKGGNRWGYIRLSILEGDDEYDASDSHTANLYPTNKRQKDMEEALFDGCAADNEAVVPASIDA